MEIGPTHLDEAAIIERLQKGDRTAFEWLFKHKYATLCFYATKILGNTLQSEEIVSDAFADIWQKRNQISFNSSITAYLFTTVHNKCINHLKHFKVSSAYAKHILATREIFNIAEIPDRIFDEKAIMCEIERAIQSLPEKCREIFRLSRYENKKYREIAEILQISPKTVESQMSLALEKLRKSLKHLMLWLF